MAIPAQADDMDRILARFGEVQEEYEHLGGYALESQAREVLHGLGFEDEQIDGDVGALSGGWKMRVAMARVLLGAARRPADGRADEPSRHRVDHLARVVPEVAAGRAADDLARSRLHEPHRLADRGDRRRRDHQLLGQLRLLRARAGDPRGQPRGGLRPAAGDAGQGAAIHRAVRRACRQGGAGAEPRQGAREDREDRAAEEAARREVRFPAAAALGRSGGGARGRDEGVRPARRARRPRPDDPTRRALVRDGAERLRQDDAAEDGRRRARAGRGRR